MVTNDFWEDARWGEEHYINLQKQYQNKWVAIVGKKVISYGENRGEVKKRAMELTGKKDILLIYIESGAAIY
ncbi:MAG: DUF5678 domain-containing protein [Promethearchaeota archaeon]